MAAAIKLITFGLVGFIIVKYQISSMVIYFITSFKQVGIMGY